MDMHSKKNHRARRHMRVRSKIRGTNTRPRLSVFRSNRYVWAQLIDDIVGKTALSLSDFNLKKKGRKKKTGEKTGRAFALGEALAKAALEKKIESAVFDRGGYKYHGLVKAVADGARKGGLKI